MTTKTTRPLFERVTCSRCSGSGSDSWNAMNGSRCFGCGGSGFTLTKAGTVRAIAAKAALFAALEISLARPTE